MDIFFICIIKTFSSALEVDDENKISVERLSAI